MAHLMNELPDVKVRLRAEPADEFSARVLGALAPGAFEASAPTQEGDMCGCAEPDEAPVLRLPQFMSRDGYEASHVTAEWAEVFPGLQCRVRHFIYDGDAIGAGSRSPDAARLDFRLTPPDGQARD